MLLNNVPVAQGLFVNAFGQLNNVQIYNIERIELIRGPGSAVYGADALTGVINIVTKTATDINGTELGARAGSFDTYDGWFLHGGQYGGFDVASARRAGRSMDPARRLLRAIEPWDGRRHIEKLTRMASQFCENSLFSNGANVYEALEGLI